MRTITANQNQAKDSVRTIGDIVSQRHSPHFFENDFIKVILPLLQESDIPAAGVLDDEGRLVGLLTERAILRHIFATSSDRHINASNVKKYIDDMTVDHVMIPEPETLDHDITVDEAAATMLRRGYRFMPVVRREDRSHFLGIVSERELALQLHDRVQDLKRSERSYQSLLSYMFREPYGSGCPALEF